MKDTQNRPLLGLVNAEDDTEPRARSAWARVADGVEAGLIELGPHHPLRPVFLRMLCRCRRAAGLSRRGRLSQTA